MKFYLIILIIIGSLLFLHCLFSFILFENVIVISKKKRDAHHQKSLVYNEHELGDFGTLWKASQNFEKVSIKSRDGLKLNGEYLENRDAKYILVMMHGYYGSCYGKYCEIIHRLNDKVQGSFLITEERAFHTSEGRYTTFGAKEQYDAIDWVNYISQRNENKLPVVLVGYSLGAATVLLASDKVPSCVKLIIADSGFSSAYEIINHKFKTMFHVSDFPAIHTANIYCKIFAHFNLKKIVIANSVKNDLDTPILYIHGTADTYVPYQDSIKNASQTTAPHSVEIFDGAIHVRSFLTDPDRYIQVVSEKIIEKCL